MHIIFYIITAILVVSGCNSEKVREFDYKLIPVSSYSNFKDFRKFYFDNENDVAQKYRNTYSLSRFIDLRYNLHNNIDYNGNMQVYATNKILNYAGSQSAIITKPNFKPFEQNNTLYIRVTARNIESNGNGEFAIWAYFINSKGKQFSIVATIKSFGYALKKESGISLDTSTNILYYGTILNNSATLIDYKIENNVYTVVINKDMLGVENIQDYRVSLIGIAGELANTPKTFMNAKIDWLDFGIAIKNKTKKGDKDV